MKNDLRALIMLVAVMSASACGRGSSDTNATANTADGRPANVAASNSVTGNKTADDSARSRNTNRTSAATADGHILCKPGDPHFKSQQTTSAGLNYYECYNDEKDVRVAAYFTRMKGISYMVLGVAWTLEDGAAPLQVITSSVSMKYVGPDGHTARLTPVYHLDPEYNSTAEILFAEQHGLKATTIEPGSGYGGFVYFSMPDQTDSPKDKADGRYVAEIRVRGEVIAFQFPERELHMQN